MINSDALKELTELCQALREAERAVTEAEENLKRRKERARQIAEEDIPGLMSELEIAQLTLDTGERVTVTDEVYASIPKNGQGVAFQWLEEHGFGDLIKTEVAVRFGREELQKAEQLVQELAERELEPIVERSVHPQTLRAWLKEQLAAAADVPLDVFGARPVKVAKLKAAR